MEPWKSFNYFYLFLVYILLLQKCNWSIIVKKSDVMKRFVYIEKDEIKLPPL